MSRRTMGLAAAAALLCLLLAAPAGAETLKPTRRDDPKPNGCKPRNCSLREAVVAANASTATTKIVLGKGRYRLRNHAGASESRTSDLDVIGPATIVGKGPNRTAIEAPDDNRVIQLGFAGRIGRPDYALRNLAVKFGTAGAEDGGGILVGFSKTTLTRVAVSRNTATNGGGIAFDGAEVAIRRSTFDHNGAEITGGAVYLPQAASISTSTASIAASTVFANAAAIGGGIALEGEPPPAGGNHPELDLVNSTLVGNAAAVSGGGIHANNGSIVAVDNTTIADNIADFDGAGGGAGGGVRQATNASFAVTDSILARNSVGATGFGTQCEGTFDPTSGNLLVGQDGSCSLNATVAADPLMGTLAPNGGPTRTIRLLTGSPAIGLAVTCPAKDQRGVARPSVDCDAGAFERPGP